MPWRLVRASACGAGTIAVAVLLGWLDVGSGIQALTGAPMTRVTIQALIGLLCWAGLAAVVTSLLFGVGAGGQRARGQHPRRRALAVLIAGLITLAAGLIIHGGGYNVCCAVPASTQRAEDLAR